MFWDNFKSVCDDRGLKPTPIMSKAGIPTSSIGRWQQGASPRAEAVLALADVLECSTDLLIRGSEFSTSDKLQFTFEESELIKMLRVLPEGSREFICDSIKLAYDKEMQRLSGEKRLLG